MPKNDKLINRYKYLHKQTILITPAIYASLAIALSEKGWGYKRINDLFVRSQEIWQSNTSNVAGMVRQCEEITGIALCDPQTLKDVEYYNRKG